MKVGAQNMHWEEQGAWTGEISAAMVKDCGATMVELGHSERRTFFNETDETVALKVKAAVKHGLLALVCIGDTKAEYDAGETAEVLERQTRAALSHVGKAAAGKVIIAYEPVWSIGEGGVPADPDFANEQHKRIKAVTAAEAGAALPVLYGGSVNPQNCCALAAPVPHRWAFHWPRRVECCGLHRHRRSRHFKLWENHHENSTWAATAPESPSSM